MAAAGAVGAAGALKGDGRPGGARGLAAFLAAPQGSHPIAQLPHDLARAIGSRTRQVHLSADTLAKQRLRHPELGDADYEAAAGTIADPDLVLRQDARCLKLLGVVDGAVLVVVKRTADAGENFVVSAHRMYRPKDLRRLLRLHEVVSGSADRVLAAMSARAVAK